MNKTASILQGLAALLVTLLIVAGAPFLLVRIGRTDIFAGQEGQPWWALVYQPGFLLAIITVLAWLAWALATLSILAELASVACCRRFNLPLPGVGVFAPASAVLVTAILGLLASSTTGSQAAHQPRTPAVDPGHLPLVATEDHAGASESQRQLRPHVVRAGEDLWTLAEQFLGDGSRWRQIAAANDTTLLDPITPLEAGTQLFIPVDSGAANPLAQPLVAAQDDAASRGSDAAGRGADAAGMGGNAVGVGTDATGQGADTAGQGVNASGVGALAPEGTQDVTVVTVQPGDSLWAIAERVSGDPTRWRDIVHLNPDRIVDPDQIDVGWQLKVPRAPSTATKPTDVGHDQGSDAELDAGPDVGAEGTQETDQPQMVLPDVCPADEVVLPESGSAVSQEQSQPPGATQAATISTAVPAVAGISAALAAGVALAIRVRRGRQLSQVPIGRRPPQLSKASSEVDSAITRLASQASPQAQRCVVRLGQIGERAVTVDLAAAGRINLVGEVDAATGLACAVVLELLAEPDAPVQVVAAGSGMQWLGSLEDPRLQVTSTRSARQRLEALFTERSNAKPGQLDLATLRAQADTAEAWAQTYFVFDSDPRTQLPASRLASNGVAVLACQLEAGAGPSVFLDESVARLADGTVFDPDHVSAPARRALQEILTTAATTDFEPAAWWPTAGSGQPATVTQIRAVEGPTPHILEPTVSQAPPSDHPFLSLLGPVSLEGARGPRPPRAVKQCEEYCGWLLEHPGATAPMMARSLLVAETTRRSNMSRLRTWLGQDDNASPYLPEAYSGRIHLHPAISSDWEQFRLLLAAGVNRASEVALRRALELVRGAPLADAAPGQWHWAEEMRAEMILMIRDAAVVLGRHNLARGDYDSVRWAVHRGLQASPEDELLLGLKLLVEHRSGNRGEVDRLVLHITRQARILGVDLMDETVELLQEVVEGQARLRMA